MAYDEGLAQIMRDDLAELGTIREVAMFGGVCFMKDGHMLCGVHKGGAMYRVGKGRTDAALAIPGAQVMAFTGRPMPAFVDVDADAFADDTRRGRWLAMALENVAELPPKEA